MCTRPFRLARERRARLSFVTRLSQPQHLMLIVVIAHSDKAQLNGSALATSRNGATSVFGT